MAENPLIKRYLDAGMAFTQMTQARAEAIVKDLVRTGEIQAQRTEELVTQLVDRSRKNTERLLELVRREVQSQVAALGLATQDDIARLEDEVQTLRSGNAPASKRSATKKSAAKKKSSRKKSAGKKSAGKKSAARKRAAAKKSSRPAKKSGS